ncbi:hypothetical protein, partial [Streptomyces hydrogenans]
MKGLVRIAIIDRCPDHQDKVIYQSFPEALTYSALNRIRYGGRKRSSHLVASVGNIAGRSV